MSSVLYLRKKGIHFCPQNGFILVKKQKGWRQQELSFTVRLIEYKKISVISEQHPCQSTGAVPSVYIAWQFP